MISTRTVYRRLSKVLQDASKCSKWSLHSCPKVPKRCLKVSKVSQWFQSVQGVTNRWQAQLDSLCAVKSHHHQMPGIPTNYFIFLSTQYISITIHDYRQNNTVKYTNKRIQNTKIQKYMIKCRAFQPIILSSCPRAHYRGDLLRSVRHIKNAVKLNFQENGERNSK